MKYSKKPNLDEYDEYIEGSPEYVPSGAVEHSEIVESLINNKPDSRNQDNLKKWKKKVNKTIDEFNKRWGSLYKKVQ